ncbi:MAG: hypothetical protein ACE363_10490 [Alphaproteobacteria bacterium]
MSTAVRDQIDRELDQEIFRSAQMAANDLADLHGATVAAVLFYGSCLRLGTDDDKILDFYVLCDDLRAANGSWFLGVLNHLLPPNVYYREIETDNRTIRSKYALMSLEDFEAAMRPTRFNPSFWARFAQPAALAYVRDPTGRGRLANALTQAVVTAVTKAAPMCTSQVSADALWSRLFELTYRAELRAEKAESKGREIFGEYADRYRSITEDALRRAGALSSPKEGDAFSIEIERGARRRATIAWRFRILHGKGLSLLRLMKAAITFSGGLDYLAWKIRRHSGVEIEVKPWQRRHPLIGGLWLYLTNRGGGGFS